MPFAYTFAKKEDIGDNNFIVTSGYDTPGLTGVFVKMVARNEQIIGGRPTATEMYVCEFGAYGVHVSDLASASFITLVTLPSGDGITHVVRAAQFINGIIFNSYLITDIPKQPKFVIQMNAYYAYNATLSGTDILVP